MIATANSLKYCDLPSSKIVPMLADEGYYMASESSFYRVLRQANQLSRKQAPALSKRAKPLACEARGANQVWSWDITYLPTLIQGRYYYLYMVMDIYSRKIIGWSVHETESSSCAANLMKQCCLDEKIMQNQLTLHSDNGAPMKGATMLCMLQQLGVIPSFSRPSVSDDNPFSESLFKTLKYHSSFPLMKKFNTLLDARKWCISFVRWYNEMHLHSALKFVTPVQRHNGEDKIILRKRHEVYQAAKEKCPMRWSRNTRNWVLSSVVTLNPDRKKKYLNENEAAYELAA